MTGIIGSIMHNRGVVELIDRARGIVIRHGAPEIKRVIPDVIAGAQEGPRSNAGLSPAPLTIDNYKEFYA